MRGLAFTPKVGMRLRCEFGFGRAVAVVTAVSRGGGWVTLFWRDPKIGPSRPYQLPTWKFEYGRTGWVPDCGEKSWVPVERKRIRRERREGRDMLALIQQEAAMRASRREP